MMGYGLGMVPDFFFIWSGIPDTQTKISVSEKKLPCYKHMEEIAVIVHITLLVYNR